MRIAWNTIAKDDFKLSLLPDPHVLELQVCATVSYLVLGIEPGLHACQVSPCPNPQHSLYICNPSFNPLASKRIIAITCGTARLGSRREAVSDQRS